MYDIRKKNPAPQKLLETQNSQKRNRPTFPRWLRKAVKSKNKRHLKKTLDRAVAQGYFSANDVTRITEQVCANKKG